MQSHMPAVNKLTGGYFRIQQLEPAAVRKIS